MPDTKDSARSITRPAKRSAPPLSRRFSARRLLVATIGAATVNYAAGCQGQTLFTSVANLMAPPFLPDAGSVSSNPSSHPAAGALASVHDAGATEQDAGDE